MERYMVIRCFHDYFITTFDDYDEALKFYKDRVNDMSYGENIMLIKYIAIKEAI